MTKQKKSGLKVENPVEPKLKIGDANFSPDGLKDEPFPRKKRRFFDKMSWKKNLKTFFPFAFSLLSTNGAFFLHEKGLHLSAEKGEKKCQARAVNIMF